MTQVTEIGGAKNILQRLHDRNCWHLISRIFDDLDNESLRNLRIASSFFEQLQRRYKRSLKVIWIATSDYDHTVTAKDRSEGRGILTRSHFPTTRLTNPKCIRKLMVNEGETSNFMGCLPREKEFDPDLKIFVKKQDEPNVHFIQYYKFQKRLLDCLNTDTTDDENLREITVKFGLLVKLPKLFDFEVYKLSVRIKILYPDQKNYDYVKFNFGTSWWRHFKENTWYYLSSDQAISREYFMDNQQGRDSCQELSLDLSQDCFKTKRKSFRISLDYWMKAVGPHAEEGFAQGVRLAFSDLVFA